MPRVPKKKSSGNYKPYKLGTAPEDTEHIYITGENDVLFQLRTTPDAICKYIPGTDDRYIMIPCSRTNFMIAEAMAIPDYVTDEYKQLRNKYMCVPDEQMEIWQSVKPKIQPDRQLRPFQDECCALAYDRRMFNASEQGTGKTVMTIALIKAWSKLKTLIICPKSMIWQWEGEFTRTLDQSECDETTLMNVIALDVPTDEARGIIKDLAVLADAGIHSTVIMNYDKIVSLSYVIARWKPDVIVFDESWRIKNMSSKVTQHCIILADNADKVLCLNGTPFGQDVTDLWPQIYVVSPDHGINLPTLDDWKSMFAMTESFWNGGRNITKLVGVRRPNRVMQYMADNFYRATKAICLPELPEKYDPIRVELPMSKALCDLYSEVNKYGDSVFDEMSLSGDRIKNIRLQQLTSGIIRKTIPRLFTHNERLLKEYDASKGPCAIESPKRDWCIQYAKDVMLGNPKWRVIIWCSFTLTIHTLVQALTDVLGDGVVYPVTGATNLKELEQIKTQFNSRDPNGIRCLVVQTKKMAFGQNLQGCDWNIIYDHPWSFIMRDQLEDRSHRMGREGPVGYTELVCTRGEKLGTIDHVILEATEQRAEFSTRFGPDTSGTERLELDEVI